MRSRASPRRPPDRVDGVCGLLPRRHRPDDRRAVSRRADARAVRGHGSRLPGAAAPDSERVRSGTDGGLGTGPGRARRGTRRARREERGGSERKIKSHLTCGGSQHHFGRSHEARPLRGTSWFDNRRGARSVAPRAPSSTRTGCRRRADRGRTACRSPWPRPARESPHECTAQDAPRSQGDPQFFPGIVSPRNRFRSSCLTGD